MVAIHLIAKRIEIEPLVKDLPPETIEHFLLDQVFPRIVAHSGLLVLHAGGAELERGAVAFLGSSGAGKSTLTGQFHKSGAPLLSDDALVVTVANQECRASALYPGLRLFPDSIDGLFPSGADVLPFAHYTSKQRVAVPLGEQNARSSPLRAFVFLAAGEERAIGTRFLPPAEVCMGLVKNSFSLDPADVGEAHKKLMCATTVAQLVPGFELSYPRHYSRLPEVEAAVRALCASLDGVGKGLRQT